MWGARALPGTRLTLVHVWTFFTKGACFALLDDEDEVVWRLDLPHDYRASGDDLAEGRLQNTVRNRGAILDIGEGGTFALWHVRDGQRVRYRAVRDESLESGWRVDELGREPFELPDDGAKAAAELGVVETLVPKPLGSVALQGGALTSSLMEDVVEWDFDGAGGFLLVRRGEEKSWSRVHVDRAGAVIDERAFESLPMELAGASVDWFSLGGDQWLLQAQTYGGNETGAVLRASGATGRIEPFPDLRLPRSGGKVLDVSSAVPTRDGGLVVLGTLRSSHTSSHRLIAFAENGSVRWSVREGYPDEAKLFSPEDVTVTPGGHVVVLDNVESRLQVFDEDGKHLHSTDLAEAWGREPNYPSGVHAAPDGSLLVEDFRGEPPLWHVDLHAGPRSSFVPRLPNGGAPESLPRNARFAPDGSLWTTEGDSLMRLGDDGVVVETLGEAESIDTVRSPGAAAILPGGRIAVQDQQTGALHVWSESGERLFVGDTDPSDVATVNSVSRITSGPDGSVWVEQDRSIPTREELKASFAAPDPSALRVFAAKYLGWSATGERLGSRETDDPAFAPDGQHVWTWGYRTAVTLRDTEGAKLARVERRSDGGWIRSTEDVCFDSSGEAWVLDHAAGTGGGTCIASFTSDGRPLSTVSLPEGVNGSRLSAAGEYLLVSNWKTATRVHARSGKVERLEPGLPDSKGSYVFGFSADGKRLLVLDHRTLVLHRFEAP